MPKNNRGGRRAASAQAAPPVQTAPPAQAAPPVQAPPGATPAQTGPANYQYLTDKEAAALRQQQDDMYNGSVTAAVKMYISGKPGTPAANVDGKGHSMSQTMNYLMENGVDLANTTVDAVNRQFGLRISPRWFASMQYSDAYMAAGAHPIGRDVILTRAAHADVLRNSFGIQDYSKMSAAQLQQTLVGKSFTAAAPVSTAYEASKSPFLNQSSGIAGGREVIYNIKAGRNTNMLFGAKSQAEIILSKGTNFRITGVRYTGVTATPRGGRSMPQIVLDVETF